MRSVLTRAAEAEAQRGAPPPFSVSLLNTKRCNSIKVEPNVQQVQQQLRVKMQLQQQQHLQHLNEVQQQNAQQTQPPMRQAGLQLNVSGVSQAMASQVTQTVTESQWPTQVQASVFAQISHAQQGNTPPGPINKPLMNADRTLIWKGVLEWVEKSKNKNDAQKQTWQAPFEVSATSKDGEPEVKAESWPLKLIMQLMPKMLIGNIGQAYLKNSKSVVFYSPACDALESLIKVMSNGFAGYVHFTSTPTCNIKVLLLLYAAEKRIFVGFIPNDQQAFVDRLREVIQHLKSSGAMNRIGTVTLRGNSPPGPVNQPLMNADRTVIWKGVLEWVEKSKNINDAQKQTWQVPFQVSATSKDGEPEVKAESWPLKLIMQLMPKTIIGYIGKSYFENSKKVLFYPPACDALESLIKVMSNGFAGCVHFTSTPTCNIKVLLLLYAAEKRTFVGFIPNDQQAFVDRLRKVIQQQQQQQMLNMQVGQQQLNSLNMQMQQ